MKEQIYKLWKHAPDRIELVEVPSEPDFAAARKGTVVLLKTDSNADLWKWEGDDLGWRLV